MLASVTDYGGTILLFREYTYQTFGIQVGLGTAVGGEGEGSY